MELNQLEYFVEVAKCEHVTQAAERLHISQSAVSKVIARLEDDFGTKLFDRSGKHIKLNEYGKVVLRNAERIFDIIDETRAEVKDLLEGYSGSLKISTTKAVGISIVNLCLRQLVLEYPNIQIEHYTFGPRESREALLNRIIDLAIADSSIVSPELEFKVLVVESVGVLISHDHPLFEKSNLSVKDLINEPFYCMSTTEDLIDLTNGFCLKAGFAPNIHYIGNSPELVGEAISQGKGIAFISEAGFEHNYSEIFSDTEWVHNLACKPLVENYCKRSFGIAVRKDRYLNLVTRNLFDTILAHF